MNFTDGQTHDLALYAVDWDRRGRSQEIEIIDPATGKVLDNRTMTSYENVEYLKWTASGHVRIKVINLASPNAVVSGLFSTDGAGRRPAGLLALKANRAEEVVRGSGEERPADRLRPPTTSTAGRCGSSSTRKGGQREKGTRKDCHAGFGSAPAASSIPGLAGGEFGARHLTRYRAAHGHSCREARSPLAILVHQGSDPTLPHQAFE